MNIIEGIQKEIDRVEEIIKEYKELPKNAGAFASMMMENSIKNAKNSIATDDTIGMLKAFKDLQEYQI